MTAGIYYRFGFIFIIVGIFDFLGQHAFNPIGFGITLFACGYFVRRHYD
jgi:hypothetical protein